MAKKHSGGIVVATGFRVDNPSPLDDRLVVGTLGDLTSSVALPNVYGGILVTVSSSNYDLYKWNGEDRTNLDNWSLLSGSINNVDTSISSSFASTSSRAFSSSFASTSSFTLSSSFASTSSFTLSSSFALTASHVLNLNIESLTSSFNGNRPITTAQIPGLFNINPYENAYGTFNEDSSSINDFLEAVFYPPKPNLPPIITSNNQISINEFKVSESLIHTITAIDQTVLSDPTTLDIISTYRTQSIYTDDFFRIDNPNVGEVTLNTTSTSSMNLEGGNHINGNSHPFYIEVGDARGAFTKQTIYIRINPDDKPEFITPSGILNTINEFEQPGLFIANIEGTDTENGVTFQTSSNNTDNFFNISEEGTITLTSVSNKSMNTDPIQGAYPLDIEVLDQFNQSTLRTFFIKIKPNTPPIFKNNNINGSTLEGSLGIGIYAPSSTTGTKGTIHTINNSTLPLENDILTLETGSLSNTFTNDFQLIITNNETTNPFIDIQQYATNLNANENVTHTFILTASDSHYQSEQDLNSVSYLTVNLNVTNNSHPQLTNDTQSFSLNENTDNGFILGELSAFDPDAGLGVEEQPFIHSLQLIGAFKSPSTTNITNSLNGNSIFDPHQNPFEKNSNLEIKRKNNVFLNSDIANLYKYQVNIGGDFTGSGADIGVVEISILDHEIDNTFNINWIDLSIIESARNSFPIRRNSQGFGGLPATMNFNSSEPHTFTISSSNDFITTQNQGNNTILKLNKNLSGSNYVSGDTIEVEITASQTNFPTTTQSYKYDIIITPNTPPNLTINTNTYINNHSTNGAINGNNILATINYPHTDAEGDPPNFDSFIFDGNSLTTILDTSNNRYEVRSTANLGVGTYPFTASLKDIHGFSSSSVESSITIREAGISTLSGNNTDINESQPLFYIIETANETNKVVKESSGKPTLTQAILNVSYQDIFENSTTAFTAFVGNNSNIFSITQNGEISAGSGFNAQSYSVGTILETTIQYTSNTGANRFGIIYIKVTENEPPTATLSVTSKYQSIYSSNTLIDININNTSVQTSEFDTINTPVVSIGGFDTIVNTLANGNFEVNSNGNYTVSNPLSTDYTTTFSSNNSFQFYVIEGALEGDNVVISSNGNISGTPADIGITYGTPNPSNTNYSVVLTDSSNKSSTYNGVYSFKRATATVNNFSITVNGDSSKFSINSHGNITVGSGYNYTFGDGPITAVVTATNNYNHTQTKNITINITENHAPTATITPITNLVSPLPPGTTLFQINAGNINDTEQDNVSISHPSTISFSNINIIGTQPISSPYTSTTFQFQNEAVINNQNPPDSSYTTTWTKNNTNFYVIETATNGNTVRTNSNGIGGSQADLNISFSQPSPKSYNYNVILEDDTGLQNSLNGTFNVSYFTAGILSQYNKIYANVGSQGTSTNQILNLLTIDSSLRIGVGSAFANQNLTNGDVILAKAQITNNYNDVKTYNFAINVVDNQPPSFTINEQTSYQAPITPNSTLLTIQNITDPESDNIGDVVFTVTNPNGTSLSTYHSSISGYSNILIKNSSTINTAGTYSYSIALQDEHGNTSTPQTGTFTIAAAPIPDPEVYFYKWDGGTDADEAGTLISLGRNPTNGTIVNNTVLGKLRDASTLSQNFSPIYQFGGSSMGTMTYLGKKSLSTLSDGSSGTVNGNGISQLGNKSYSNQRLLILFPPNVSGKPSSMYDGTVAGITSNISNRYFLYYINPNTIPGVAASGVYNFTKNGETWGLLFTEAQRNGTNKFYLIPDEITTNLPTT